MNAVVRASLAQRATAVRRNIVPGGEQIESAAMPRGSRRLDPRWRYRTKEGDAALAIDGDMRTAWTVSRPLKGDEFFEVVFDRPIRPACCRSAS